MAIDATGPCFTFNAVLLALLVSLLVLMSAEHKVRSVNQATDDLALQLMAPIYPLGMCVNGSRDSIATLATTAQLKLACKDIGSTMWQPKKAVANNVAMEMDLLNELGRCGVITSCYFAGEVPHLYGEDQAGPDTGNQELWQHSIPDSSARYTGTSTCNTTEVGGIGELLKRRTLHTNSNFSSTFILAAAAGQSDPAMVNYYLQATPHGILTQLLDVPVLSGTWRLELADGAEVVWLQFSQTSATAQCLGNSQHNFCGAVKPVTNGTPTGPQAAVLVPDQFVSYRCSDGVDAAHLHYLETFRGMAKHRWAGRMMGNACFNRDVVYALYAGAAGAMFALFAALMGSLAIAMITVAAAEDARAHPVQPVNLQAPQAPQAPPA